LGGFDILRWFIFCGENNKTTIILSMSGCYLILQICYFLRFISQGTALLFLVENATLVKIGQYRHSCVYRVKSSKEKDKHEQIYWLLLFALRD
jgi:hypothetical protein